VDVVLHVLDLALVFHLLQLHGQALYELSACSSKQIYIRLEVVILLLRLVEC
jgi:hypothetical protein